MRIRTIKPEFWEHPVMGRQSDATKLLAIGLLNLADDEGYFYADPKAVRNAIRPNDDDSRIATVSLRDLSEIGYISIREHATHGPIGKIDSFASHQVINKPKTSKIKALYESGINTVSIPDCDRLEGKGKEGNKEGNGKEILSVTGHDQSEELPSYPPIVETLWGMAPHKGRDRSSKKKLADEWKKLKPQPDQQTVIDSFQLWSTCHEWTRDGGQYAPGVHIWVKDRKWENGEPSQKTKPTHRQVGYQENLELP